MAKKDVPFGVKIISVLHYISSAVGLFIAMLLIYILIVGSGVAKIVPSFARLGGFLIVGIIIFLALAILNFFIGLGLWKGQKWSRMAAIIFSIIFMLVDIFLAKIEGSFGSHIITIAVSAIIAGYLAFSARVKAAFS